MLVIYTLLSGQLVVHCLLGFLTAPFFFWIELRHRSSDWRKTQCPDCDLRLEVRLGEYCLGRRGTDVELMVDHRRHKCYQTLFDAIDEYVFLYLIIVICLIRRILAAHLELFSKRAKLPDSSSPVTVWYFSTSEPMPE